MIAFIGILYGILIVLLIYFISFVAARGLMTGGAMPFFIVLGKYLIYWAVISFGFKHLPTWAILTGLISGVYLSLPILYIVNKKLSK